MIPRPSCGIDPGIVRCPVQIFDVARNQETSITCAELQGMDKGGGGGAPKEFGELNNLASGDEDEKKRAAAAEELRIKAEYEKPKVGTPQEIVHLIAWAALLMLDVQCCKRAFRDLIGRLIELGPIFANFDQPQEDEGKQAISLLITICLRNWTLLF